MKATCQIIASDTGNLKEIQPHVGQDGNDNFVVGDMYGNGICLGASIAYLGLMSLAKARGMEPREYFGALEAKTNEDLENVQETAVVPIEPKPEEKKEEPNVPSIQE